MVEIMGGRGSVILHFFYVHSSDSTVIWVGVAAKIELRMFLDQVLSSRITSPETVPYNSNINLVVFLNELEPCDISR